MENNRMQIAAVFHRTSFCRHCCLSALFLVGIAALPAQANMNLSGYETSYTVTLDAGVSTVTNIQLIEQASSPIFGDFWSQGGPQEAPGGTTTSLNGFVYNYPGCPCLPVASLLGGIITDASGQQHFVLFMSDAAASLVAGVGWATAFPGIDENQLITNFPGGSESFFSFAFAAQTSILNGQNQPVSALFTPGDSFSVLSWSDGELVGSGTSTVTPLFTNAVPEPAYGICLVSLLGALFLVLRTRRLRLPL
jgi:hypothetical protein